MIKRSINRRQIVETTNRLLNLLIKLNVTVRQIFYVAIQEGILQNTEKAYNRLSDLLVTARLRGEVDWRRIEDRGRDVIGGDYGYNSKDEFLKQAVDSFKNAWRDFSLKMWETQPKHVEVWVEKDTLSGVVSEAAKGYRVFVCPTRGDSSFSYVMRAVERFAEVGKPVVILYFGDFDPSGWFMPHNLVKRIHRYGRRFGYELPSITLERVALNWDQIEEYGVLLSHTKVSDNQRVKFIEATGSDRVAEVDALHPSALDGLVRQSIERHINSVLWNQRVKEMEAAREALRLLFEGVEIKFKP
jgi:hypothetical protein